MPPNFQNKTNQIAEEEALEKIFSRHQKAGSWHLTRRVPSPGGATVITL
jgi:hypothetical protein